MIDAYYLAKLYGDSELNVVWPKELGCASEFDQIFSAHLFEDIKLYVYPIEYGEFAAPRRENIALKRVLLRGNWIKALKEMSYRRRVKSARKKENCIRDGYRNGNIYFDYNPSVVTERDDYRKHSVNTWNRLKEYISENGTKGIYIKAFCGLIMEDNYERDYSRVIFNEKLNEEAQKIIASNMLGVHIRRTDHVYAKSISTDSAFISTMNDILLRNPDICFFVASDDYQVEKKMKQIYGEKVIIRENKIFDTDSTAGLKDAIIDCLCLSKCSYILGSCGSVFSQFAASFGKRNIVIVSEHRNGD